MRLLKTSMFNNNLKYSSRPRPEVEYFIKGSLKNYAFEAKCFINNVFVKIDIGHWGGNYGGETIPITNVSRLSEYLTQEALQEVEEYKIKLDELEYEWKWDIPYLDDEKLKLVHIVYTKTKSESYFEFMYYEIGSKNLLLGTDKIKYTDLLAYLSTKKDCRSWILVEFIDSLNATFDDLSLSYDAFKDSQNQVFIFTKETNFIAWIFYGDKSHLKEIRWQQGNLDSLECFDFQLPIIWANRFELLDFLYPVDLEVIKNKLGYDFMDFYSPNNTIIELDETTKQQLQIQFKEEKVARVDLLMQHLRKLPQESALQVFKEIGQKIELKASFIELNFDKVTWEIGNTVLFFNRNKIEYLSDSVNQKDAIINEAYTMKTSLLLEIEINGKIVLAQLDKLTGEILKVKLT